MNQRLQQFLSAENISQAQFADTIEVARASVSHVLAGRNKPGYDFIRSISDHYPKLNLEWLISGKGKMYKQDALPEVSNPVPKTQSETFNDELFGPENNETEEKTVNVLPLQAPGLPASKPDSSPSKRNISRIIVFYDDNTYQELK